MPEASPTLPRTFDTADSLSRQGQRHTLRATSARLLLTVFAALALALGPLWRNDKVEVLALVAAVLFLMALFVEFWLLRSRPERKWYDGRAVAESAKTLAWRYAVGALPYPINDVATAALERDMRGLATDVDQLRAAISTEHPTTPWMERLRSSDLHTRQRTYLRDRIEDQAKWYSRKAAYNARRAKGWSLGLLTAEALGVVLALLKAWAIVEVDLASLASAVIAAGAAWLAVKQHESIGTAYSLASRELAAVRSRLMLIDDEAHWAVEVADAEEAISREHTMWRASRTVADPNVRHDNGVNSGEL